MSVSGLGVEGCGCCGGSHLAHYKKDMEKLFDTELFADDFEGWRDRTVIELFYATGMRLSELRMLTFSDIDLYNNQVKVMGKRNKERIIPFGHSFQNIFNTYVAFYSEIFAPPLTK